MRLRNSLLAKGFLPLLPGKFPTLPFSTFPEYENSNRILLSALLDHACQVPRQKILIKLNEMPDSISGGLADTFNQSQLSHSFPRLRLNICPRLRLNIFRRSLSHGCLVLLVSVSVQEEIKGLEPHDYRCMKFQNSKSNIQNSKSQNENSTFRIQNSKSVSAKFKFCDFHNFQFSFISILKFECVWRSFDIPKTRIYCKKQWCFYCFTAS